MTGASFTASVALVAGIIGAVVGLGGIVSVVQVIAKYKTLESNIGLFGTANEELRAQVDAGREDRHRMTVDFERRIADERTACARETGELRGQIAVLTGNLGKDIAAAVLSAFKEGQASATDIVTTSVTATTTGAAS